MLLQLYLIKHSHEYKILNQIIGKISRSCVTDQEKINTNDLYYQCSKHGPDCLFGKLRIKDFNDGPHFHGRIKLLSYQIQMNTLFNTNVEKKRRYDKSIHKPMIIPVEIHQTKEKFSVTVQPKNTCKLEFVDYLWLSFLDEPQSEILFFVINNFQIYNIIVTKCKHRIFPTHIITCNE